MRAQAAPVSVIVPVYNGERYLAEAIRSVLAQTLPAAELLIADDGSTDATPQVCADFVSDLRYLRLPHAGVAAALNAGIAATGGEWLAFLDADDLWPARKLERQFEALESRPDTDMIFGRVRQFRTPELSGHAKPLGETVLPGPCKGTMLIRRSALRRTGPFAEHWRVGEFVEWYLRGRDCGLREVMLDDVLLERRLHEANMGLREPAARVDFARIIKATLDRRRRGDPPAPPR